MLLEKKTDESPKKTLLRFVLIEWPIRYDTIEFFEVGKPNKKKLLNSKFK